VRRFVSSSDLYTHLEKIIEGFGMDDSTVDLIPLGVCLYNEWVLRAAVYG